VLVSDVLPFFSDSRSLLLCFKYSPVCPYEVKYLPPYTSHVKYFTLIGFCSNFSLACLFRPNNSEHYSRNHRLWCFNSQYPTLSWAEILMISLNIPYQIAGPIILHSETMNWKLRETVSWKVHSSDISWQELQLQTAEYRPLCIGKYYVWRKRAAGWTTVRSLGIRAGSRAASEFSLPRSFLPEPPAHTGYKVDWAWSWPLTTV
jgi:hypothetical protein